MKLQGEVSLQPVDEDVIDEEFQARTDIDLGCSGERRKSDEGEQEKEWLPE